MAWAAAGCAVVLKPDPQTPLSVLRIAELAAEVGFPAGAINVVPGDGPTTGSYLVRHAGVDKVAFTGSTVVGQEVMRNAADTVKRWKFVGPQFRRSVQVNWSYLRHT